MSVEKQAAIIYCGTHALLSDIPVEKVKEFEVEFLDYLELKHKDITSVLESAAKEIVEKFK